MTCAHNFFGANEARSTVCTLPAIEKRRSEPAELAGIASNWRATFLNISSEVCFFQNARTSSPLYSVHLYLLISSRIFMSSGDNVGSGVPMSRNALNRDFFGAVCGWCTL